MVGVCDIPGGVHVGSAGAQRESVSDPVSSVMPGASASAVFGAAPTPMSTRSARTVSPSTTTPSRGLVTAMRSTSTLARRSTPCSTVQGREHLPHLLAHRDAPAAPGHAREPSPLAEHRAPCADLHADPARADEDGPPPAAPQLFREIVGVLEASQRVNAGQVCAVEGSRRGDAPVASSPGRTEAIGAVVDASLRERRDRSGDLASTSANRCRDRRTTRSAAGRSRPTPSVPARYPFDSGGR